MAISDAIGSTRKSTIIGYAMDKGTEGVTGGYLPQSIAIIAEANTANQTGLTTKLVFTAASEVAEECGYGSPAHLAAKRVRGTVDVGGVQTVLYPLVEAGVAVAQAYDVTLTGTPTKSATQYVVIAGNYIAFTVLKDATAAEMLGNMKDAINAVIDTPVIAGTVVTDSLPITAKWAGQSSADISLEFAGDDVDVVYTATESAAGAGEVLPTTALNLIGSEWDTTVVNCLGTTTTILDAYEDFNGNSTARNGRYNTEAWKPLIAISGTIENDKDDLITITDSRKIEQTNVMVPCARSLSLPLEIAATAAAAYCPKVESDPKADLLNTPLISIVAPQDLEESDLDTYNNRDVIVKAGCCTTVLEDGSYVIKDFVTTYHPDGESPAQFSYVRDLAGIDFNIAYRTMFLDATYFIGKTILPDSNGSTSAKVIKPKDAKSILINKLIVPFANEGIIADATYSIENLQVEIDSVNPTRLNFKMPYKRSSLLRITSTNAVANFYLGGS